VVVQTQHTSTSICIDKGLAVVKAHLLGVSLL
jgi:hypothetical protein